MATSCEVFRCIQKTCQNVSAFSAQPSNIWMMLLNNRESVDRWLNDRKLRLKVREKRVDAKKKGLTPAVAFKIPTFWAILFQRQPLHFSNMYLLSKDGTFIIIIASSRCLLRGAPRGTGVRAWQKSLLSYLTRSWRTKNTSVCPGLHQRRHFLASFQPDPWNR